MNALLPLRAPHGLSVAFCPHRRGTSIFPEAQRGSEALACLCPGETLFLCQDSADSIFTQLSTELAPFLINPLGTPATAASRVAEALSPHLPLVSFVVVLGKARLAVLLLLPRVLPACCCCGCAPVLWAEPWGKGSSIGKKNGAARLGTCHLWMEHGAFMGQPSPKTRLAPHAHCKLPECCFSQHHHVVYPQETEASLEKNLSFTVAVRDELHISPSERALALSGLPFSACPMSRRQALQHRNDAARLGSSFKIFNNSHPLSAN